MYFYGPTGRKEKELQKEGGGVGRRAVCARGPCDRARQRRVIVGKNELKKVKGDRKEAPTC